MAGNLRALRNKIRAHANRRSGKTPPKLRLPLPKKPLNDKGQPVIQQGSTAPPPLFPSRYTHPIGSGAPLF